MVSKNLELIAGGTKGWSWVKQQAVKERRMMGITILNPKVELFFLFSCSIYNNIMNIIQSQLIQKDLVQNRINFMQNAKLLPPHYYQNNQLNIIMYQQPTTPAPYSRNYDAIYEAPVTNEQPTSVPNHNELTTNGVCKKFIHGKCRLSDNCPHPHDKSKIKPCNKFESMGQCGYGDKCNFSHDLKICPDFMRQKCDKGEHCSFRHVYKSCPNFDMGFCFHGKTCKFKHIVRKLCWDYMYGFCEKGAKCPDYHPKIFVEEDFIGTKKLFEQLSKSDPQYYICNYCAQIGHKVSKCPKRMEIEPKDVFKCGLCGNVHSFADDCNYKA